MQYTIMIQYDKTDGIYIASIPELPGCVAHGKTRESALREVSLVYEMWVEEAKELGKPIPEPSLFVPA